MVRNQKVGIFSCSLSHFLFLAEMRKAVLPELLPSVGLKPCTAGDSSGCEEQALTLIFLLFSPEVVWFWCPPGVVPILLCHPRVGRGHRGDRLCLPGWMGLTQRMEHPGSCNPSPISTPRSSCWLRCPAVQPWPKISSYSCSRNTHPL